MAKSKSPKGGKKKKTGRKKSPKIGEDRTGPSQLVPQAQGGQTKSMAVPQQGQSMVMPPFPGTVVPGVQGSMALGSVVTGQSGMTPGVPKAASDAKALPRYRPGWLDKIDVKKVAIKSQVAVKAMQLVTERKTERDELLNLSTGFTSVHQADFLEHPPAERHECVMCHEFIRAKDAKTLPCGHSFHFDCIDPFLRRQMQRNQGQPLENVLKCPHCQAPAVQTIAAVIAARKQKVMNDMASKHEPELVSPRNRLGHNLRKFGRSEDYYDEVKQLAEESAVNLASLRKSRVDLCQERNEDVADDLLRFRNLDIQDEYKQRKEDEEKAEKVRAQIERNEDIVKNIYTKEAEDGKYHADSLDAKSTFASRTHFGTQSGTDGREGVAGLDGKPKAPMDEAEYTVIGGLPKKVLPLSVIRQMEREEKIEINPEQPRPRRSSSSSPQSPHASPDASASADGSPRASRPSSRKSLSQRLSMTLQHDGTEDDAHVGPRHDGHGTPRESFTQEEVEEHRYAGPPPPYSPRKKEMDRVGLQGLRAPVRKKGTLSNFRSVVASEQKVYEAMAVEKAMREAEEARLRALRTEVVEKVEEETGPTLKEEKRGRKTAKAKAGVTFGAG